MSTRSSVPAWRRYLTFWRTPIAQDVDDELRFHANMRVREYVAQGMSEDDARRAVAERLGDVRAARAACIELGQARERNARNASIIDALRGDLRFADRQFRRHPAFAALAIATAALGIGANTAIFSIVHHVLLDPLPFPDGNQIVVFARGPEHEMRRDFQFMYGVPTSAMRRLAVQSRTVTEVSAVSTDQAVISGDTRSDTVSRATITTSFLPMLRVRLAIGRAFTDEDARPASAGRTDRVRTLAAAFRRRSRRARYGAEGQRCRADDHRRHATRSRHSDSLTRESARHLASARC